MRNWQIGVYMLLSSMGWAQQERANQGALWSGTMYFPYENDLVVHADTILKQLPCTISGDLKRFSIALSACGGNPVGIIRSEGYPESIIELGPDSTLTGLLQLRHSEKRHQIAFEDVQEFLIIAGHSGNLNEWEMSSCGDSVRWKDMYQITSALDSLASDNDVAEFLFLQNCSKSSIEVLYEMAPHCKYTLASQFPIGAPNFYYGNTLAAVSSGDIVDGFDLGMSIIENDRSDMFLSYTLVENEGFLEFVEDLKGVISNETDFNAPIDELLDTRYGEETFVDLIDLMRYWVGEGFLTHAEFKDLKANFDSCVHVVHSPGIPPELEVVRQFSGVSVWYGNDSGVTYDESDFTLYNFPNWNR